MDLDAAVFAVVDVETTGLSAEAGDRIVEVGSIRLCRGREVDRFHTLVQPGIPVPPDAQRVHRISSEMLLDAPPFDKVARDLRRHLAGAVLVAQNAPFDLSFLNAEFERAGLGPLQGPAVDTVALARRVRPGLGSYRLDRLADHFRVRVDDRHRSIGDCEITAGVFLECLRAMRQKGEVRSLEDLLRKAGVTVLRNSAGRI